MKSMHSSYIETHSCKVQQKQYLDVLNLFVKTGERWGNYWRIVDGEKGTCNWKSKEVRHGFSAFSQAAVFFLNRLLLWAFPELVSFNLVHCCTQYWRVSENFQNVFDKILGSYPWVCNPRASWVPDGKKVWELQAVITFWNVWYLFVPSLTHKGKS